MTGDGAIEIVPSVHFSATHRRRVRDAIRDADPDLVAVELDERRFERLERGRNPNRRSRLVPDEPARGTELPPTTTITYETLRAIQRAVVRLSGLDPGRTDMEVAVGTAAELGVDVALIDDPIEETVAALSRRVGPETLPKLVFRSATITPQQRLDQLRVLTLPFEEVKEGADVRPAVDGLRHLLPEVAEVLIDRRDRAMAERLHAIRRRGLDAVAVIGAGHHDGVRAALADLDARDAAPTVDVPVRRPGREVTRIPIDEPSSAE
ncbi:TraB domain-containing protein [Salinilacihabitans rarus]|uniref:TraB domain-containing protein n=1 Tax=Salinilacihabitans rarus TaxID=2961596 RepID=UPI0020C925B9|nr:TraB/GumN family protein [Salinilacihabitans rarus]